MDQAFVELVVFEHLILAERASEAERIVKVQLIRTYSAETEVFLEISCTFAILSLFCTHFAKKVVLLQLNDRSRWELGYRAGRCHNWVFSRIGLDAPYCRIPTTPRSNGVVRCISQRPKEHAYLAAIPPRPGVMV
ncbi:hypothetical protein [Cohnella nanjingensis]|uniref:hypothetical protein n=1 Tax=Cohnella nanjingensis TaxID=1387779 RepID=UPI001C87618C|nr:hypothetical protein [Cohnella nanjingensis]